MYFPYDGRGSVLIARTEPAPRSATRWLYVVDVGGSAGVVALETQELPRLALQLLEACTDHPSELPPNLQEATLAASALLHRHVRGEEGPHAPTGTHNPWEPWTR